MSADAATHRYEGQSADCDIVATGTFTLSPTTTPDHAAWILRRALAATTGDPTLTVYVVPLDHEEDEGWSRIGVAEPEDEPDPEAEDFYREEHGF